MLDLFIKGGPIMWPLLLTSVVALTTVLERAYFIVVTRLRQTPKVLEEMLALMERGEISKAVLHGRGSKDYRVKVVAYALQNRERSLSNAVLRVANIELNRFNRGLAVLDTVITLAPLLGLLGTVTGMISAFGLLGASELDAPTAITGGIAEALIATAFGLGIAILSLLPFNFLNAKLESARHEIEDIGNQLEIVLLRQSAAEPRTDRAQDQARLQEAAA